MKTIQLINNGPYGVQLSYEVNPGKDLQLDGYSIEYWDRYITKEEIDDKFTLEFIDISRGSKDGNYTLEKTQYIKSKEFDLYFSLTKSTKKENVFYIGALYYKHTDNIDAIIDFVENNTHIQTKDTTNQVSVILKGNTGFRLQSCDIKTLDLNVETMYNDDFMEIDQIITDKLSNEHKGIIMLHGEPGTGKTNYIKHLTSVIKKDFIFVPSNFIHYLTDPSILDFLLQNKGKILVLEDSENYIKERGQVASDAVSTLLNLSDGIMADILKMQIICTFNDKISNIDSALLRKGRLIASYEFKELSKNKALQLGDSLGLSELPEKLTLAQIFNTQDKEFSTKKERKLVGFGS